MGITATKSEKSLFYKFKWKAHNWNKCFWKTGKPFLTKKVLSSERIKLAEENDTLIINEEEFGMKLNDFFSNTVINLKIPKLGNFDLLSENVDRPTFKDLLSIKNILSLLQ